MNNQKQNILQFRDVIKEFNQITVLKGISFNIKEGDFFTIVGPSGCGKSTILNLINGILQPDYGDIFYDHKKINKWPTHKRPFNTIFQEYALFEHLNVYDNVAYGLRIQHIPRKQIKLKVYDYLKLFDLEEKAKKSIHELSGGQKQRVAITRALINKPKILLLDEPMAALDVHLRQKMRQEFKRIQKATGITIIWVTHDQEEALMMSSRIMVLNKGIIQQIDTPEDIYNTPDNAWVANFMGKANIINNAVFLRDFWVRFDDQEFKCLDTNFGENENRIDIVIRPEDIIIQKPGIGFFEGIITDLKFKGLNWEIKIKTKYRIYEINTTKHFELYQKVSIDWDEDTIHVMWKEIDD